MSKNNHVGSTYETRKTIRKMATKILKQELPHFDVDALAEQIVDEMFDERALVDYVFRRVAYLISRHTYYSTSKNAFDKALPTLINNLVNAHTFSIKPCS